MKRLVCFMLALIIALSFVACKSEDIILISSSHANAEVQNESSSNSEPISSNASINNHTHQYVKTQKTANCGESGGILYSCSCGDSYMENAIFPSYEHDFVEENISIGNTTRNIFRCTQCNVEALYVEEWWNLKTKFKEIRYYISGKLTASDDGAGYIESDYEIVVCGVGDIEDYNEKKGNPPWREFLGTKLKSITVANGITSIGKNAFCYRTAKKQDASFYIGGSVKTIKSGAISLNIDSLVLEEGIKVIEANAISGAQNIYIPKSVEVFSDLGRRSNICYYYKGKLDDLLKIRVDNPAVAGGPECSFKERCEWSILNSEEPEYFCTVVVNSSKIGKGNALFDGKETKTDAESLKPYIK